MSGRRGHVGGTTITMIGDEATTIAGSLAALAKEADRFRPIKAFGTPKRGRDAAKKGDGATLTEAYAAGAA